MFRQIPGWAERAGEPVSSGSARPFKLHNLDVSETIYIVKFTIHYVNSFCYAKLC